MRVRGEKPLTLFCKTRSVKFWKIDKTRIHDLTTGTVIWYIYIEHLCTNFAGSDGGGAEWKTTVICAKPDKEGNTWQVN